jgi:6-methylpretetramide 4-monooxygenase / 4-hydroxy-6-methylpretetramide 12a-monooxygenase
MAEPHRDHGGRGTTGPQVLVVGAGPVGLTTAYELTRRGVRVRLVDAQDGPAVTSRAIAVHPRTMETYDQMGLYEAMDARGLRITAFTIFSRGSRLARLDADYSRIPTRFDHSMTIDQVFTEEVLRDGLEGLGVTPEWGVRIDRLEQEDTLVRAFLRHADGREETVETPWLIGCDGGHSTVRKQLALPLVGDSNETWMLADAQMETELPRNSIYLIHLASGTLMLAPMPGEKRWRMLDTVETDHSDNPDRVAERFSRKLSEGLGHQVRVKAPSWVSVFTAQQRMVPQMRLGRCFVSGDAAHVHSPASGQGMNTGIQEAYNLAWKLAMVVNGQAGEALLDSYSTERVPVGQELLESTRQATSLIALKNAIQGLMLPVVFTAVRNVGPLRRHMQRIILGRVSGLSLAYGDSPLTVDGAGTAKDVHPAPGERVTQIFGTDAESPGALELYTELRDIRWTLLAVPDATGAVGEAVQRAAAEYKDWLSVRTVTAGPADGVPNPLVDPDGRLRRVLGAGAGGWLLVRPDGYLAARGTGLTGAQLQRALAPVHLTGAEDGAEVVFEQPSSRA